MKRETHVAKKKKVRIKKKRREGLLLGVSSPSSKP